MDSISFGDFAAAATAAKATAANEACQTDLTAALAADKSQPNSLIQSAGGIKSLIILFILFLVVVSDVFTNSVIGCFGENAVRCRVPTTWGIVLQGICLVVLYSITMYLSDNQIL